MPKRFPTPDPQIFMYEDGTFYLRLGDKERSLGTKDFGEAAKKKVTETIKLSGAGGSSRLRCMDLFDDYVDARRKQVSDTPIVEITRGRASRRRTTISRQTLKEIEDIWRLHLRSYWAQVRLSKIDEQKWNDYVNQSLAIDLANHRKVFLGFLKWCKGRHFIQSVPDLKIPKVDRRPRRVLRDHEIRALFTHSKGSLLLFISMYLFMGMRRKEIMTLRWSDIVFEGDYLVLRKSEVKIRVGRSIPLNAFVKQLLVERLRSAGNSPFVFPNRKTPKKHADLGGLKTAWNTAMRRCGFEPGYITPHDLRATFEAFAHKATEFTDTQREKFAGASVDVQKKHYVHFDAHDVRGLEAVVQVDGLANILSTKVSSTGNQRGNANHDNIH